MSVSWKVNSPTVVASHRTRSSQATLPSILIIADGQSPIVHRWLVHAVARGYRVYLMSVTPPSAPIAGVTLVEAPRALLGLPGPARYLVRLPLLWLFIRRARPHIVHSHYGGGYGLMGALTRGRSPFVLSLWGSDLLVSPRRSRMRAALPVSYTHLTLPTSDLV